MGQVPKRKTGDEADGQSPLLFDDALPDDSTSTTPPSQKTDQPGQKDHRHGHRDRLRQRFLRGGIDALQDYEVLELLLFLAIPRRDVKPLAKQLIERFGSVGEVLSRPAFALEAAGLSLNAVAALKTVEAAAGILAAVELKEAPILHNSQALTDYLQIVMARRDREQFRILFLDRKNRLIADEVQNEGTINHAPVYPREIAKRAFEVSASAVILVHNHPSGDSTPSEGDIKMTQEIVDVLSKLDIQVHDHVVIGRSGHHSFRSLGLI